MLRNARDGRSTDSDPFLEGADGFAVSKVSEDRDACIGRIDAGLLGGGAHLTQDSGGGSSCRGPGH